LLILSPTAWLFELAGGAIGDFENSCLPKEQREAAFTVAALHQWDLGIEDPRCVTAAEDVGHPSFSCATFMIDVGHLQWLDGTLKPVAQGGPLPVVRVPLVPPAPVIVPYRIFQFLGRSETGDKTKASFGKNWDRLAEVKRKYDPTNLFRNTFWPLDTEGRVVEPSLREPVSTFDHVPKFVPSEMQTDAGTV
jgi:hypothetical protein